MNQPGLEQHVSKLSHQTVQLPTDLEGNSAQATSLPSGQSWQTKLAIKSYLSMEDVRPTGQRITPAETKTSSGRAFIRILDEAMRKVR